MSNGAPILTGANRRARANCWHSATSNRRAKANCWHSATSNRRARANCWHSATSNRRARANCSRGRAQFRHIKTFSGAKVLWVCPKSVRRRQNRFRSWNSVRGRWRRYATEVRPPGPQRFKSRLTVSQLLAGFCLTNQSGRQDLNLRPLGTTTLREEVTWTRRRTIGGRLRRAFAQLPIRDAQSRPLRCPALWDALGCRRTPPRRSRGNRRERPRSEPSR